MIKILNEFQFFGIIIDKFMNWGQTSWKLWIKSPALGHELFEMIFIIPALKITYDPLIVSHKQLRTMRRWFEWARHAILPNRMLSVRSSKSNTHTDSLFECLHLLALEGILNVHCIQYWYECVDVTSPNHVRDMFQYNNSLCDIETRNHDRIYV